MDVPLVRNVPRDLREIRARSRVEDIIKAKTSDRVLSSLSPPPHIPHPVAAKLYELVGIEDSILWDGGKRIGTNGRWKRRKKTKDRDPNND